MSQHRTRTRNTNGRAPIRLSSIEPDEFNIERSEYTRVCCPVCRSWRRLTGDSRVAAHTRIDRRRRERPCTGSGLVVVADTVTAAEFRTERGRQVSIVCPVCTTWRLVEGEQTLKIKAHEWDVHGRGEHAPVCEGSGQVVVIDLDEAAWERRRRRLLEVAMPAENRRAAQQFSKPIPPPAPALIHMDVPPPSLASARTSYLAHRGRCVACVGTMHCLDGRRLASAYVALLPEAAVRERNRELLAEIQGEDEAMARRKFPRRRAAQWAGVLDAVREADAHRDRFPDGDAPTEGPEVPLEPLRIGA